MAAAGFGYRCVCCGVAVETSTGRRKVAGPSSVYLLESFEEYVKRALPHMDYLPSDRSKLYWCLKCFVKLKKVTKLRKEVSRIDDEIICNISTFGEKFGLKSKELEAENGLELLTPSLPKPVKRRLMERHAEQQKRTRLDTPEQETLSRTIVTTTPNISFNRSSNAFWSNLNQTWQRLPSTPNKCHATCATEMDGKVYVSGIVNDQYGFASFIYDINKKEWSPLTVLSRLYYITVAVHSKKHLIAIGGSIPDTNTMSSEISLWDEKHKQWVIQYPNMPTARCSVAAICYRSAVIVAGGITSWRPWAVTRVVEVLNINDGSLSDSYWSTVDQLPHLTYGGIPLLCNDTLYISSIIDYVDLHDTLTILTTSVSKLLKSKNTNTVSSTLWKKLPDTPYSSYAIVCYQDHLITFTGVHLVEQPNNSKPVCQGAPQIHIYNPDTMTWDYVGSVSFGYVLCGPVYIGENKILFIGGLKGMCNEYNDDNWMHVTLQLELTPVVHKQHPSIIPY